RTRYTLGVDRYSGYSRALFQHGLTPDPELAVDSVYTSRSGFEAAARLIERGVGFDGLVCQNDLVAIGVLSALNQRGISVPEQVAIVGAGDLDAAAYVHPPLSSVRFPSREEGVVAGRRLVKLIEGEPVEELRVVLPATLVARQ